MATCAWCNKSGFFLSVNRQRVCKTCNEIINMDINQRGRIVVDSIAIVKKTKKAETKLSRLSLIKEHCEYLTEYDVLGFATLTPSPREIIGVCDDDIRNTVEEHCKEVLETAQLKADLASTANAKANAYSKALLQVKKIAEYLPDPAFFEAVETKIRQAIHSVKLEDMVGKAEKHYYKGKLSKALDLYHEAAYYIKTEDVDEKIGNAASIEEKIERLKEEIAEK